MKTPTHRCKICKALWRKNRRKGTWSLVSPVAGKCCDNEPMGEQIESLTPRTDAAEIINQDANYGFFCGGDPRDFHPDGESCSGEEIENHRKACALWDESIAKGETPTPESCPSGWNADHTMHILRSPYGIGVTSTEEASGTVRIEFSQQLELENAKLRAALSAMAEEGYGSHAEVLAKFDEAIASL